MQEAEAAQQQRQQAQQEREQAWLVQAEEKKRAFALQRVLPKTALRYPSLGGEAEVEVSFPRRDHTGFRLTGARIVQIQRHRHHRLNVLLPTHLKLWDSVRATKAALAMGVAESEVARDRVRMVSGEVGGRGGAGMAMSLSGGM